MSNAPNEAFELLVDRGQLRVAAALLHGGRDGEAVQGFAEQPTVVDVVVLEAQQGHHRRPQVRVI